MSSLQLLESPDLLSNGLKVREHAPEPALRDVVRAALNSLLLNDRSKLLLGANEQDLFARENDLANGVGCHVQPVERLSQVDDVDPVPFGEDELLHLRIPTASLVSEMDPSLEKIT